jgi:DNA polymerase IV
MYGQKGPGEVSQPGRTIIHADLDAFFAAAEVRRRPDLRGKPVIIGGRPGGRGVVAAASYEARVFGVRSAMPISQAVRLCPDGIYLPGDGSYYRELSGQFRAILEDFTELVEMVSVDEAYLDISHSERTLGTPRQAAEEIKRRVRDELQLVVSLGVSTSRMVSKIASDMDKPDGLCVVEPGTEAEFLSGLPVGKMPGIGPKAVERLHSSGIRTLGELAQMPVPVIEPIFGKRAEQVIQRAKGIDNKPVDPDGGPAKSISHERTFGEDLTDPDEIRRELYRLAEATGRDMRQKGIQGSVVAVKLRYADFETVGKQRRLPGPTDAHQEIMPVAEKLVEELLNARRAPVRLLGVRMSNLTSGVLQLSLFDNAAQRQQQLNQAIDQLTERHGKNLIMPGSLRTANQIRKQSREDDPETYDRRTEGKRGRRE